MKYSVVIATYNRADDLRDTLGSLAQLSTSESWEVIVVDNNSKDHTATVVAEAAKTFPVKLSYIFEPEQGRSAALNTGIQAAVGEIVVTTDDDVRVKPDWLDQAAKGLQELGCDYVGGKVLPIWGGPRPKWLPNKGGPHWAVIALLDYGPEPIELTNRAPLGVNMAFYRDAFERVGQLDNRIGRKAGTLLGQEVRDWCKRARAAGLKGYYLPDMVVNHIIPADRLNKRYFRRWFYWRGISRAIMYEISGADMARPEQTVVDLSKTPHIKGVPRYYYRQFLDSFVKMMRSYVRRDPSAAFENEIRLWFYSGIFAQRWKDSGKKQKAPQTNQS